MIPYFLLYIFVIILFLINFKGVISKKTLFIFTSITLILFGGLRYDVGWDYAIYEQILRVYRDSGFLLYDRGEYLSNLLYKLSISTNIYIYFIITSAIIYFFISLTFYKVSKFYIVSYLFFLAFPLFYLNSFSVIRNFVAIAITFYASKYIIDKKFFKYILMIFIAILFHKSAIIALLGLVPLFLNITPIYSLVILLISFLLRPLWQSIIFESDLGTYEAYTHLGTSTDGQTAFLILGLIYIVMLIQGQINYKYDVIFNKLFLMYTIGIGIFINFWGLGVFSHRLSLFFTIYATLLLPYLINNKYRFVLFFIMCTMLYMYMIVNYYFSVQNDFIPYKVLFW